MAYTFTDYNDMVGEKPRQVYWKELQDAVFDINTRILETKTGTEEHLEDTTNPHDTNSGQVNLISLRTADDPLSMYPIGITVFSVSDETSTGYPESKGTVETIYVALQRNIQHFFAKPNGDDVGKSYVRQWDEEFASWTSWEEVPNREDLQSLLTDYEAHRDNADIHFSAIERTKLESIVSSADRIAESNVNGQLTVTDTDGEREVVAYAHPSGDGNLHVPATGSFSDTYILKAGSTAGSISWAQVDFSELTGLLTNTQHGDRAGGTLHAGATESVSGFLSAADKIRLNDMYLKSEVDEQINTLISGLAWRDSVATYNDIATTYPDPEDGWTVNVEDDDITYRYTGTEWVAISANAIPLATTEVSGKMSSTDKTKLDTIATNAQVNQDDATIKTQYENNADTNAFTDADKTRLDTEVETIVGAQAKADAVDSEQVNWLADDSMLETTLPSAYQFGHSVMRSNGWGTFDNGVVNTYKTTSGRYVYQTYTETHSTDKIIYYRATDGSDVWDIWRQIETTTGAQAKADAAVTDANTYTDTTATTINTKLDTIEEGAEVNHTSAEVKVKYEANADTNAFTDADQATLAKADAIDIGGRNYVVLKDYTDNMYVDYESGSLVANNAYAVTDLIPVESSQEYTISASTPHLRYARYALYDATETYISGNWFPTAGNEKETITTTANTAYMRWAADVESGAPIDIWKIERGNQATDWTPSLEDINASLGTDSLSSSETSTQTGSFSTMKVRSTTTSKHYDIVFNDDEESLDFIFVP